MDIVGQETGLTPAATKVKYAYKFNYSTIAHVQGVKQLFLSICLSVCQHKNLKI